MLLDSIIFVAGAIVGALAVWGYAEWQWKRNPDKFKTIVDGVIAYRETKEKQMDKNGARGRAESIVASLLRSIAKATLVDKALEITDLTSDELAMVKQEIRNIAQEHSEQAKFHKAIESGEFPGINRKGGNPAGDIVKLYIGNEEDETEGQCYVGLDALGYNIGFDVSTPEEALTLYNALLKVKEVTAG